MPKGSRNPLILTEAHIERSCTEWLELDGWRTLKTDPVSDRGRGKGFGEVGMADRLYIRYGYLFDFRHVPYQAVVAEVLWIEWKSKRGRAASHQVNWIAAEVARGALVWLAGIDFPAGSIEAFQEHYRASGLMRRNL